MRPVLIVTSICWWKLNRGAPGAIPSGEVSDVARFQLVVQIPEQPVQAGVKWALQFEPGSSHGSASPAPGSGGPRWRAGRHRPAKGARGPQGFPEPEAIAKKHQLLRWSLATRSITALHATWKAQVWPPWAISIRPSGLGPGPFSAARWVISSPVISRKRAVAAFKSSVSRNGVIKQGASSRGLYWCWRFLPCCSMKRWRF